MRCFTPNNFISYAEAQFTWRNKTSRAIISRGTLVDTCDWAVRLGYGFSTTFIHSSVFLSKVL